MTSPEFSTTRPTGDGSPADPWGDPGGLVPLQRDASRPPATPERRLMAAVLAQALDDVRRGAGGDSAAARRLRESTRIWFTSPGHAWPYSFERICAVLDLDVDAIRERVVSAGARRASSFRRVTGPRTRSVVAPSDAPLERRVA
jgi:hypothetical protein